MRKPLKCSPLTHPPRPQPQRLKWDAMLHRTELVDTGRSLTQQAEQIVVWHRK